jgi:hypothetical protein
VHYQPFHKLGRTPNIVVDGPANEATVLALSHWRGSGTPTRYRADLSAQIVFNFLDDQANHLDHLKNCHTVSSNHFDEDGLVSMFSLLYPERAINFRDILIDVASAGDFGVFRSRHAARISFVISAWSNPELSPLNQSVLARPYPEITAVLYEELLIRLPNVIEKIDHLKRYWEEEDEFLSLSEAALEDKIIVLEEFADIDLAVVYVSADFPPVLRSQGVSWVSNTVHPMAIHNKTERMKILIIKGNKYQLYCRYETWVDYASRTLVPRVDLSAFAEQLTKLEKRRAHWQYNGNGEIISRLKLVGGETSAIAPTEFIELVKLALRCE